MRITRRDTDSDLSSQYQSITRAPSVSPAVFSRVPSPDMPLEEQQRPGPKVRLNGSSKPSELVSSSSSDLRSVPEDTAGPQEPESVTHAPQDKATVVSDASSNVDAVEAMERGERRNTSLREVPNKTLPPPILRNISFVAFPTASPNRKSVAFDANIAVDILQPQYPAQKNLLPGLTGVPLVDTEVSPDTSPPADTGKEGQHHAIPQLPDVSHRYAASSGISEHPQPPQAVLAERPGEEDADEPSEALATGEGNLHAEVNTTRQPVRNHRRPAVKPGKASSSFPRVPPSSVDEGNVKGQKVGQPLHSESLLPAVEIPLTEHRPTPPDVKPGDDRGDVKPKLPPEALSQPVIREGVLYDYVLQKDVAGWSYRSGVVMPLHPEIHVVSLGCGRVAQALQKCRNSSVYKRLRELIWRFHLDLEDLNKTRQRQWVALADNCIALVNRMMEDLGQAHTFRDRWNRGRYGSILGDAYGREPNTIFFMFRASVLFMQLGARYCQEARSVLQMVSFGLSLIWHVSDICFSLLLEDSGAGY